jgi:hypothetical protein
MPTTWAPAWFGLTALLGFSGIAIQLVVAARSADGVHFTSPLTRGLNVFAYFTILSNLLVGITSLRLAWTGDRGGVVLWALRHAGLVAITITGFGFHVLLAHHFDLRGWAQVANVLLHSIVPAVAVLGWLLFGPRRCTSWPVVGLSLLYVPLYVGCTMTRGAIIRWYPYSFLDVDALGYERVAGAIVVLSLLFAGFAAGYHSLDARLDRDDGHRPAPLQSLSAGQSPHQGASG